MGQSISKFIENNHNIVITIFFIIFLLIGLGVFRDYGVGWDEGINRFYGHITLNYVFGNNQESKYPPPPHSWNTILLGEPDFWDPVTGLVARTRGPAYEVLLVSIEKVLNLHDSREILLLRHVAGFLMFFIGSIFFYMLSVHIFHNWKIGLLGSLFLILSPRIFSHSFHNSADIPFLSMFIVGMYTLLRYLEEKNMLWASLHAAACAIMIDIRIAGITIPFITIIFVILDITASKTKKSYIKKIIPTLFVYFFLLSILVVLLWPYLWGNPIKNFIAAFKASSNYSWLGRELYFREMIGDGQVPWHFTPAWMFITTPPIYTFFALIGLFDLIKSIKAPKNFYLARKAELIAMFCFFLPLITVALFKSTLFCGWRHMFFIYPGFLVLSLGGVLLLFEFTNRKFKASRHNIANGVFVFIIIFNLFSTASFMIKSHPHQNVYFNSLVGGLRNAKGNFEIGYWGPEFREGLEYILKNDSRENIDTYASWEPVWFNAEILTPPERERIRYVGKKNQADYFLSNYHRHPDEYEFDEVWSRKINGVKIMTVYGLKYGK